MFTRAVPCVMSGSWNEVAVMSFDKLKEIRDALCHADSLLSLIAWRGRVNWEDLGMCSRDDVLRASGQCRALYNELLQVNEFQKTDDRKGE